MNNIGRKPQHFNQKQDSEGFYGRRVFIGSSSGAFCLRGTDRHLPGLDPSEAPAEQPCADRRKAGAFRHGRERPGVRPLRRPGIPDARRLFSPGLPEPVRPDSPDQCLKVDYVNQYICRKKKHFSGFCAYVLYLINHIIISADVTRGLKGVGGASKK